MNLLNNDRNIRLVLLDPGRIMHYFLQEMKGIPNVVIVCDTKRFTQALEACATRQPSALLLTIDSGVDTRLNFIQEVHQYFPMLAIVVVSAVPSLQQIRVVGACGVRAYLTANVSTPDLLAAIRLAASGGYACCPETASILEMRRLAIPGKLSSREALIAERIAAGESNCEIAKALGITNKTVECHVRHIFEKIGARSRVDVATWWLRQVEQAGSDNISVAGSDDVLDRDDARVVRWWVAGVE